jgi:hypothetical protein
MFPPKDSKDSNISSLVRFDVDLNASRSMIWLTPRKYSFSYRDPASMNTPTPEKCPGNASVATRTPFGNVEIWSSSAGSFSCVSTALLALALGGMYLLDRINYGREVSRPERGLYAGMKRSPSNGPGQDSR